ncbi:Egg lysin OS=Afipia felis OX=1035 GN=BN961_02303 PE=4 SV=1 [Afipia felis]
MTNDVTAAPPDQPATLPPLTPHRLRAAILNELHARPFTALTVPRRILHFGFYTDEAAARTDRENLFAFCTARGQPGPQHSENHFRVSLGATALRWEQHSEFTTYTWEMPSALTDAPFTPSVAMLEPQTRGIPQAGPLLVAVDLHILQKNPDHIPVEQIFDRASLASADNTDGSASYASDFRLDPSGFVRILITDNGLDSERAGALVQRVLEIETYRTLALLGLPEAQRLLPSINRIEHKLTEVTRKMREATDLGSNRQLLDELVALAADLEAGAAASVFRFGATRAYDEIIHQRLGTIGEQKTGGLPTWTSFLARRMAPAIRTCITTETRQSELSLKLTRAADLLRTRVNVELEKQNQELLKSMNERTRMQLRLQTTVEGLSVAAITYYVVSLFGYVAKAAHETGYIPIDPAYMIAAFIPVAALTIWATVRRIRKHHISHD